MRELGGSCVQYEKIDGRFLKNHEKDLNYLRKVSYDSSHRQFATPLRTHRRISSLHKILPEDSRKDSKNRELEIIEKLSEISQSLLRNSYTRHKYGKVEHKVKDLEIHYKITMANFLKNFRQLVKMKKNVIKDLQKLVRKFMFLSWTTTEANLVSSLIDVGILLASFLSDSFIHSRSYKTWFYVSTATALASISGSLIAMTYMRNTADSIATSVLQEKYMQIDLETMFYRGNWIDEAVQKLFPYGVDLSLISVLEKESNYENEQDQEQYMCFVILLSNVKKNMELLKDEEFLTTVKIFVESPAARIWWNRMKIRKHMEETSSRMEDKIDRVVKSSTEVFLSRTAFNLYPFIFPLFINSWNFERTRIIVRTIAAIANILDLKSNSSTELKQVNETIKNLQKQYKKVKSVYEATGYEYD